jgi:DNA repair exonuclease SbcCD ATPase subunit
MALVVPLLTGCASMSDRDKTTAQATGLGAVLGAGIGAVIGHQLDNRAAGAVIGGMVGAVAGSVYGDHVAGKKESYAKQEDYLNACIAAADKVYQEAYAYNESLRKQISAMDAVVTEMVADMQAKRAKRDEVAAVKKDLARKRKETQEQLAAVTEEIRVQKEVLAHEGKSDAAQQLAQIQDKINGLEAQKTQLMEQTQQLAALNNRMSM